MNLKAFYLIVPGLLLFSFQEMTLIWLRVVLISLGLILLNQHISIALIQLELLTLIRGALLIIRSLSASLRLIVFLIFFTVGVIEATLGLALLALTSRKVNNDLFKFTI